MQEPDFSKTPTTETVEDTETKKVEVEVTPAESEATASQPQAVMRQVFEVLGKIPSILFGFFEQYRPAIITLGLILALVVGIKIILAVISVLNDIPFFALTFELIGIVYSAWFANRYLIRASNREELWSEVQAWKEQLLGDKPTE
ncbi:MAG: hypothetical protein F6K35_31105 [Okeania sp. SIO2H7]|nr:hypothetical protein [Okeania sp. SIO2H7]